jgi:ABC-type transport system involved in multi-copper enzyme maturation permease subunit
LRVLLRKDLAELFAARAFWLVLLIAGLLVGQSFIESVNAYADASAGGALAQGLSPLDGIVTPTAGAYDLAIMLLFPFVAIRLVASEKSSDALKLMLQWPVKMRHHIVSKLIALLVAWLVSLVPFAIAVAMWRAYGGHLYAPETLNVLAGYTLRFILTAGIAMAAAAVMPGAANAAVVVLAFTIGTWALDFLATGRGGIVQQLAAYTPAAVLRSFERGLLRVDVVLVMLAVSLLALTIAGIWLRLGKPRIVVTAGSIAAALIVIVLSANVRTSFDLSENRRNSFSLQDATLLAGIREPLTITPYLAAEDPRMNDFENNVLIKLRRTVPRLRVEYPFGGRSALFENDARYGTIEYRIGSKTAVNRSTTEEIVLETILRLSGGQALPLARTDEAPVLHTKLAKRPRFAAVVFYLIWPLTVWFARRSRRTG